MLLFLTLFLGLTWADPVPVTKCCPEGKGLDLTDTKHPRCGEKPGLAAPFINIEGLDLNQVIGKRKVDITLGEDPNKPSGLPDCTNEVEIHSLEHLDSGNEKTTWITTTGALVTSRYEAEFDHKGFCVDAVAIAPPPPPPEPEYPDYEYSGEEPGEYSEGTETETVSNVTRLMKRETEEGHGHAEAKEEFVAVMCNACLQGKPCIHLCCPHGHLFNADFVCEAQGRLDPFNPEFWNHNDEKVAWDRNTDYIIAGQNKKHAGANLFTCPPHPETGKTADGITWVSAYTHTYKIGIDGSLKEYTGSNITRSFQSGQFCAIYTNPPDYSDYPDSPENNTGGPDLDDDTVDVEEPELQWTFMHCTAELKSDKEKLILWFNPMGLGISIIFLILTICVYLLEANLRSGKNMVFGMSTLAFLVNLTLCFIVVADNHVREGNYEKRQETVGCIIAAYCNQYFFLAFFFWINSMAYYVYSKFANPRQLSDKLSQKKLLWKFIIYAQGMPLLICIITAIVDSLKGNLKPNPELEKHYPNMGVYNCFLGAERGKAPVYFTNPIFIYFQSILIVLQIINIFFFGATIRVLLVGWENQTELIKDDPKLKDKLKRWRNQGQTLLRLFTIMGIFWIFEIISTAIALHHGFDETVYLRIILDLPNLFSGFLIFLVLVVKKPVVNALKLKATKMFSSGASMSVKMSEVNREKSSSEVTQMSEESRLVVGKMETTGV